MEVGVVGAKANLRYHVVLVTKYRKPALRGVEDHVYAAMRHVEAHSSIHIEEMGVEDGNHIHTSSSDASPPTPWHRS